jgi:vacuolar iron transporter family protein
MLAAFLTPVSMIGMVVTGLSLVFWRCSALFPLTSALAPVAKAVARVTFCGALAMAATAGIGKLFGVAV